MHFYFIQPFEALDVRWLSEVTRRISALGHTFLLTTEVDEAADLYVVSGDDCGSFNSNADRAVARQIERDIVGQLRGKVMTDHYGFLGRGKSLFHENSKGQRLLYISSGDPAELGYLPAVKDRYPFNYMLEVMRTVRQLGEDSISTVMVVIPPLIGAMRDPGLALCQMSYALDYVANERWNKADRHDWITKTLHHSTQLALAYAESNNRRKDLYDNLLASIPQHRT